MVLVCSFLEQHPSNLKIAVYNKQESHVRLLSRGVRPEWEHWITLWRRTTGELDHVAPQLFLTRLEQISQEQSISNQIKSLTVRPLIDALGLLD